MIDNFSGKHFFLSNFYSAPVHYEGLVYKSSEAAFQSAKTTDMSIRLKFTTVNPPKSKAMGGHLYLRPNWEQIKNQVMEDCVRDKFTRNPDLAEKLLATGDEELIEGNYWGDDYWGVCTSEGKNMLGKILMKVRDELK